LLKELSTDSPPAVLLLLLAAAAGCGALVLLLLPCWLSLGSHPDWLMKLSWAVAASCLLVLSFRTLVCRLISRRSAADLSRMLGIDMASRAASLI
jgi:hypothetical protein